MDLKIYRCEFDGLWPVGTCCIIAAYNQEQAELIAQDNIHHTIDITVTEVSINGPMVIECLDGNY